MPRRRWLNLIAVTAILAAAPCCCEAEGQEIVLSPSLANQLRGNIQVGLSSGRVIATGDLNGRNLNWETKSGERSERLKIDLTGIGPSISCDLKLNGVNVLLEMSDGKSLRIRRVPQGNAKIKYLEFQQPAEGRITVVVGENPPERTVTVNSMWHLLVAEHELVRNDIEPLLRLLRPGWPLASASQAIEQALYRQVDVERNYDRQAWTMMVERLRSPHYIERIEADRQLRELGKIVVPFLQHLSAAQLDAEQAFRIRMIVRRYGADAAEDSPEAAVAWLAADPEIWYALGRRAIGTQRTKAATQLTLLLGETVVLDPQASGETLESQLTKIRSQIDRLHPAGPDPQ